MCSLMLTPEPRAEEGTPCPCRGAELQPQPSPCSCRLAEGIQRAAASRHRPGSCGTLWAPTHLLTLVPIEAAGAFHAPVPLQG